MKRTLLFIILTLMASSFSIYGQIIPSEPSWEVGNIVPMGKIDKSLYMINQYDYDVTISILPTCDCLEVTPAEQQIKAGQSAMFLLNYDTTDEKGKIEKMYQLRVSAQGKEEERSFYYVRAFVDNGDPDIYEEKTDTSANIKTKGDINFKYYYSPSCSICQRFLNNQVPAMEKRLGVSIGIEKYDIHDTSNYAQMTKQLDALGQKERAFPVLIFNDLVLQGNKEVESQIEDVLKASLEGKKLSYEDLKQISGEVIDRTNIFSAISLGLLDGINPCAFATLISLLTALAMAGKRKKEIVIMGIFFTFSVFVTYFMVGLGFFAALQAASGFVIVKVIIHWVLIAGLFVLAGLSFYDFSLILRGKSEEMVLQLNDFFKKRINTSIRSHVRSAAIIASSIVLGFLVSMFELGCTGQVYVPFILMVINTEQDLLGYGLILLYNLAFILPLVVVFILTYIGISSRKITEVFQKYMWVFKLSIGILFIGLALYMLLYLKV